MLFKFALRNVLRNRKRSLLTAISIFVAAFVVVLANAWINAMGGSYMRGVSKYMTGHIRVLGEGYLKRERFFPVDEIVPNSAALIKKLHTVPGVDRIRERVRFGILLGYGDKTVNAMGMGLDLENNEFNLKNRVVDKAGKQTAFAGKGIYIGKDLAKRLGAEPGTELLLATRTSQGGLNGIKLKVAGYVSTGTSMFDKKAFFISLEDAKRLLKLGTAGTEILIYFNSYEEGFRRIDEVKKLLPAGVQAYTIAEQNPTLYEYMTLITRVFLIIGSVILFLASFIVINTMMMAVFERIQEIGTLKALGMTDREVFYNFTMEGGLIGAAGGIVGALLGGLVVLAVSGTGINIEGPMQGIELPFEYIVYPSVSPGSVLAVMILSAIIPSLAAMIPARYSKKLMPAEALRKI